MENSVKNKYTSFFVEMIIAIFFLSVVVLVVMKIHSLTTKEIVLSDYKEKAANKASQVIELYKNNHDMVTSLDSVFDGITKKNKDSYEINLDDDFTISYGDDKVITVYITVIQSSDKSKTENINIRFTQDIFSENDNEIYSLAAGGYFPEK